VIEQGRPPGKNPADAGPRAASSPWTVQGLSSPLENRVLKINERVSRDVFLSELLAPLFMARVVRNQRPASGLRTRAISE